MKRGGAVTVQEIAQARADHKKAIELLEKQREVNEMQEKPLPWQTPPREKRIRFFFSEGIKIKVPADIYEAIYDKGLRVAMEEHRENQDPEIAEQVLRAVEFLEDLLVKVENEQ